MTQGKGKQVKAWTADQPRHDESVCIFARAFTSEKWSRSMGIDDLGDRVAMREIGVSIESLEQVIDVTEFRRRLEEIQHSRTLDDDKRNAVAEFLEAWRRHERGDDGYEHG